MRGDERLMSRVDAVGDTLTPTALRERAMYTLDPDNDYGLIVPVMLTGLVADGLRSRLQPTRE